MGTYKFKSMTGLTLLMQDNTTPILMVIYITIIKGMFRNKWLGIGT